MTPAGAALYFNVQAGSDAALPAGISRKRDFRAVSYTHLDVYKRQDQIKLEAEGLSRAPHPKETALTATADKYRDWKCMLCLLYTSRCV